jgi:hypothetical protein
MNAYSGKGGLSYIMFGLMNPNLTVVYMEGGPACMTSYFIQSCVSCSWAQGSVSPREQGIILIAGRGFIFLAEK